MQVHWPLLGDVAQASSSAGWQWAQYCPPLTDRLPPPHRPMYLNPETHARLLSIFLHSCNEVMQPGKAAEALS